jgi:hypothetical protein
MVWKRTDATAASDPGSHAPQREMAAEWLKLADAIRYPLKPTT